LYTKVPVVEQHTYI